MDRNKAGNMDDDLPTDFQVIVVGTGKLYYPCNTAPVMMAIAAYLSILFFHSCLVINFTFENAIMWRIL